MGRPPIGKHAMSDAERQRRRRAKFRVSATVTKPRAKTDAKLEARIRELEAELYVAKGNMARNREEFAAAKRLATETRKAQRAKRAAEHMAQAPAQEDETIDTLRAKLEQAQRTIKSNNTRIKNLNAGNATLRSKKAITMSKQLVREIRSRLHPDRAQEPKERKRLEGLAQEFNSFKIVPPANE